jgi:ribosomal protein S18 acetylase RimI-like enzyme
MRIRTAEPDDVTAVLALWKAAAAEPSHTDDVGSLQRLIAHDPAALLVADVDGDIGGSIIAAWDGWRGSVYRLAIAPSQRRQGLGRRLLRAAETRLDTVGALRRQAIVVASDAPATGFWRSTDWEEQTDRQRFTSG